MSKDGPGKRLYKSIYNTRTRDSFTKLSLGVYLSRESGNPLGPRATLVQLSGSTHPMVGCRRRHARDGSCPVKAVKEDFVSISVTPSVACPFLLLSLLSFGCGKRHPLIRG